MTAPEAPARARLAVFEALKAAGAAGFTDELRRSFLAGEANLDLLDLGIDSLGAMGFCIAIELDTGITLLPAQLAELACTDAIEAHIHSELLRGGAGRALTASAAADPPPAPGEPDASRRMAQALRLYRRRAGRCSTENQWNRLHTAVENYMTPAELRHFLAGLAADAPDSPSHRWIAQLAARMPVKATRPVEFTRSGLLRGATRYTAGNGAASGKTLIIGFTGHFHRLMMPMPWLLDCLNPAAYDLVVLRDFPRVDYARGIPGLGADFFGALTELARRIGPRAYRNTIALGTSGGGMPALLAAILLELDKGIAISPQDFARYSAKLKAIGLCADRHAALLAARPDRFPEMVVAYPAGSPGDTAAALAIAAQLPVDLRPAKRCTNHAVLAWQHQRGTLPAYLAKLLGQDLESATPFAPPLVSAFVTVAGAGSAPRVVAGGSAGASTFGASRSR